MAIEVRELSPYLQVFDMPKSIHPYGDVLGFTVISKSKPKTANDDDVDWVMMGLCDAGFGG